MPEISTKPYMLRAIYEWCTDSGYTPYIAVKVDANTRVPMEFVKKNEIVLNISFGATNGLKMDNESIHFHARFGGVSREIFIPVDNVLAIYANENGQGMAFETAQLAPSRDNEAETSPMQSHPARNPQGNPASGGPTLTSVQSVPNEARKPSLSSVPDDTPDPPKKGGRPTLTRIK